MQWSQSQGIGKESEFIVIQELDTAQQKPFVLHAQYKTLSTKYKNLAFLDNQNEEKRFVKIILSVSSF